jgi:hypothetical protein
VTAAGARERPWVGPSGHQLGIRAAIEYLLYYTQSTITLT